MVLLVGSAAVIQDLRTRHISNWTSAGALIGGREALEQAIRDGLVVAVKAGP